MKVRVLAADRAHRRAGRRLDEATACATGGAGQDVAAARPEGVVGVERVVVITGRFGQVGAGAGVLLGDVVAVAGDDVEVEAGGGEFGVLGTLVLLSRGDCGRRTTWGDAGAVTLAPWVVTGDAAAAPMRERTVRASFMLDGFSRVRTWFR